MVSDDNAGNVMCSQASQTVTGNTGFRWNSFAYIVVNSLLFLIWLIVLIGTGGKRRFPWFAFPAAGWGAGLAFHARAVQERNSQTSRTP